jgi:hypothetical protein
LVQDYVCCSFSDNFCLIKNNSIKLIQLNYKSNFDSLQNIQIETAIDCVKVH